MSRQLDATIQAICCRLGLPIPGLHMRARCLPNCTQMGPHTALADRTVGSLARAVRENLNILTGIHFLGCTGKCCGTYERRNQVAQVTFAFFKCEMKFSGSTSSFQVDGTGSFAGRVWAILRKAARASTQTNRSGRGEPLLSEKSDL